MGGSGAGRVPVRWAKGDVRMVSPTCMVCVMVRRPAASAWTVSEVEPGLNGVPGNSSTVWVRTTSTVNDPAGIGPAFAAGGASSARESTRHVLARGRGMVLPQGGGRRRQAPISLRRLADDRQELH